MSCLKKIRFVPGDKGYSMEACKLSKTKTEDNRGRSTKKPLEAMGTKYLNKTAQKNKKTAITLTPLVDIEGNEITKVEGP